MSILAPEPLKHYWKQRSESAASVFEAVMPVEKWRLDLPESEVESEAIALGDAIDTVPIDVVYELGFERISELLSHLHISRAMRLLQVFTQRDPSFMVAFAEYVDENAQADGSANVNFARSLLLSQLDLLAEIFAPDRIEMIENALEVIDNYETI
jgi:hypothetical protein